jgi:guanine deaminase
MSNITADSRIKAVCGSILHFLDDPDNGSQSPAYEYFEDGLLVIENGRVRSVGPFETDRQALSPEQELTYYENALIVPGFVDTHLHYPQTDIIASHGGQLMDWLQKYAFPTEGLFEDREYAEEVTGFFLEEMFRNGTTTAMVMPTVHPHSADILFRRASNMNLRLITGKMLMDRNAPPYLLDTPHQGYEDSAALIERWHGKGRLSYAVTPRFAITSSEKQLKAAGELLSLKKGLYLHTHLSENADEVDLISALFPWRKNYLDVYDYYGLLGRRSLFAHGIHLSDEERARLAESGAAVAFCPSSNLFIGSGLFDLAKTEAAGIRVGIASDIGGGTSFSLLKTLGDAYKVLQLQKQSLSPLKAFYLATLGGAVALDLDRKIGNFLPGKEADFIVLKLDAFPLLERRIAHADSLEERLFILTHLGDDRCIETTCLMGDAVYERS